MLDGYIKLHRAVLEWEWYSDPATRSVFIHLLLLASFKKSKWKGVNIKPGQCIIGLNKLSRELGISVQQLRTALKKLENTHEINKQSTSKYTLVTIENWKLYQSDGGKPTSTSTNKQQTNNKQITNNQQHLKNVKNVKNVNSNNPPTPLDAIDEYKFSADVETAVRDWLRYKSERKEGYKPTGFKSLLTEISHNVDKYGDTAVIAVIQKSMSSNYRGIVWDRLKQQKSDWSFADF